VWWQLERVITLLDTGSYFGEGALLGELCRRENMRARTMVDLCKLETHDMKGLLQYYPHLVETLQKTLKARKGLFDGETPINFEKLQKPTVTSSSSQVRGLVAWACGGPLVRIRPTAQRVSRRETGRQWLA
jgi:CRP-like cAMP-binding protein